MSDDERSVWMRTTPGPGLTYRATFEIDDDTAADLERVQVFAHARAVGEAIARAEHDARVVAQLRHLTAHWPSYDEPTFVADIVTGLRDARDPIVWPTMLALEPGVSAFTGQAFLSVMVRGRRVGQWTLGDARTHIGHVFECLEGARLDGAYLQLLTGRFGLDERTARAAVAGLASFDVEGEPTKGAGS